MGKKKRGSNNKKKKKAGGNGGGKSPPGGSKQGDVDVAPNINVQRGDDGSRGEKLQPPPSPKLGDDDSNNAIVADEKLVTNVADAPSAPAVDRSGGDDCVGRVDPSSDGVDDDDGDDFIGDVHTSPSNERRSGDGTTEEAIGDDGSKEALDNEHSSDGCVEADDVGHGATIEDAVSESKLEQEPSSRGGDAADGRHDGLPESDDTDGVTLNEPEPNLSPGSTTVDLELSPSHDSVEEPVVTNDSIDLDGAGAAEQREEAEDAEVGGVSIENDAPSRGNGTNGSKPTGGMIHNASKTPRVVETYNGDGHSISSQFTKKIRSYSSQASMEEVDLDSSDARAATPPPLVRIFNGTLNGISPPNEIAASFSFQDSNEKDAFSFLTSSLREMLGEDAKDVPDETICRYIRWKPDVKRAAERFRAHQRFRKENAYLLDDDKPLLLSQDPKLAFLIQNGMVIAPEELVAKDGSGVLILRGAKCDVTLHRCNDQDASRAIFFVLQQILERGALPFQGISIVLDLVGVTRRNVPKKLASLLSKAAGCFPLRIKAIYVCGMPWWFPSGNTKLFAAKIRSRIHFLKNKLALSEYIEKDRLLDEDGGIYHYDLQQWVSSTVLREVEQLQQGDNLR